MYSAGVKDTVAAYRVFAAVADIELALRVVITWAGNTEIAITLFQPR